MADPVIELEGTAAIPRRNGEPQFAAPWQGRAFGIAMALYEQGDFDWEDLRPWLFAALAADEALAGAGSADGDDGSLYYRHWLEALTGVLAERGLVGADELALRVEEFRNGARRDVY
jgi:nitrile hydratase accessory protein